DLITREATSWIEGNRGQPFFLYVPYTAPHVKCLDTPEWVAKCAHVPAAWRDYAAMVAHLDDGVGKIVATLDRLGLRENTLIVFSSDNGGHVTTQPFRGAKGSVWEGGVRGVAWANWPAQLGGRVSTEPVCIVDWMPTFCGLAKAEATARLDGRDLWPMLSQAKVSGEPRSLYLLGTDGKTAALVEGDWKLIRNPAGTELYHLPSDPWEQNDRSASEKERSQRMLETVRRVSANDRDSLDPHTKGRVGRGKAF
ncbi:MAG: Arylsulfatase, partial [Verrucomicrobiota bacterium]